MQKIDFKGYTGSKSGNGVLQFFINLIPPHKRYFELYAGSAKLYYAKKPAELNVLNDIYLDVVEKHRLLCGSDIITLCHDARAILKSFKFTSQDFIYLDPPYPFEVLGKNKLIYNFTMYNHEHEALLKACVQSKANIMLSTYENEIYDRILIGWEKHKFKTSCHGGMRIECVYLNYEAPKQLNQYDFIGQGFTDRQRLKRKVERFKSKILQLPEIERSMLAKAMRDIL